MTTGRRRGFERKGTLCEKDANLADPRLVLDSGLPDFDLQEKEKGRRKGQRRTRTERRSKGTRPHVGSADQAKAGIEVRELVSDLLEERERVGKSVLRGCRRRKGERERSALRKKKRGERNDAETLTEVFSRVLEREVRGGVRLGDLRGRKKEEESVRSRRVSKKVGSRRRR